MAKAKLTFKATDAKKLKVAAHINNLKIVKALAVGDKLIVDVEYRDPQAIVETVSMLPAVSGNELDGETTEAKTVKK